MFTSQGYSRKGAALSLLHRYEEAQMAFAEGLEIDPENEQLKEGIKMARSHLTGSSFQQLQCFTACPYFKFLNLLCNLMNL